MPEVSHGLITEWPHYAFFQVEKGTCNIRRMGMEHTPSGQWKAVRLVHWRGENYLSFPIDRLMEVDATYQRYLAADKTESGRPQFLLVDFDHGTNRVWGRRVRFSVQYLPPKE